METMALHEIIQDWCFWCIWRHTLREGQCVLPFPLHTSYKRQLVTSREHRDCKHTKGEKGAVIKGSVTVILICGLSKACPEFLLAGGGDASSARHLGCENDRDSPATCEAAPLGTRGVWGSWLRGTTVLNTGSSSPETLAFLPPSGGGVEWAFLES